MILFDKIEQQLPQLQAQFASAWPYEHVAIDGLCDEAELLALYDEIPDPASGDINKSRDYMFARNKYEKSGFKEISPRFAQIYADFTSERFAKILHAITGEPVFMDPEFHGGGIHQGGEGSYLDMHTDFNFHPIKRTWFRNLNVLLYLNKGWKPEYKGQLKLRHRDKPDSTTLVEPLFNRCVIMFTRDHTVHGYDAINFPKGTYRRSIAAYAYTPVEAAAEGVALDVKHDDAKHEQHRTTVWYPEQGSAAKKAIGRHWPTLVRIKNALFGSATAKNK